MYIFWVKYKKQLISRNICFTMKCHVLCWWVIFVYIWYTSRIYSICKVGNYSISERVAESLISSASPLCPPQPRAQVEKTGYRLCKHQTANCQDLKKMTIFRYNPQHHIKKLLIRLPVSYTVIHSSVKNVPWEKIQSNKEWTKEHVLKEGLLANFTEKDKNSQNVCMRAGVLHIYSTP